MGLLIKPLFVLSIATNECYWIQSARNAYSELAVPDGPSQHRCLAARGRAGRRNRYRRGLPQEEAGTFQCRDGVLRSLIAPTDYIATQLATVDPCGGVRLGIQTRTSFASFASGAVVTLSRLVSCAYRPHGTVHAPFGTHTALRWSLRRPAVPIPGFRHTGVQGCAGSSVVVRCSGQERVSAAAS